MILCFSATGNSRYVADRIAAATGDAVRDMAACLAAEETSFDLPEGEAVGIMGPTYSWGLPSLVEDFLQRLSFDRQPAYLWHLSTYGTTTGAAGHFAANILTKRGYGVDAFFSVKMPDTWTVLFDLSDKEKVARQNEAAEPQIDEAIRRILARDRGDFIANKTPASLTRVAHSLGYPPMRRTAKFEVTDACVGCGACAKKCPVNAIELAGKRPTWVNPTCVGCLGCLHRCPKYAILRGKGTARHGQYAHPPMKSKNAVSRIPNG